MKKLVTKTVLLAALIAAPTAFAQKFSDPDKSPMDQISFPTSYRDANKLIRVTYSRPQLKDRAISKLAPEGKVWRTGANEAVEVTLYTAMNLGETKIAPGTYTLYTIPNGDTWTVILNTDLNVWGSYFYDQKNDVARLTVPVTSDSKSVEYFSMSFDEADNGANLHMGWGTMRLVVPFTKS